MYPTVVLVASVAWVLPVLSMCPISRLSHTGNTLPSLETCDQSAALIPISKSICAVQISSGEGLRQPRAVRLGEEDPIKTQSHTARQKDTACHVDEFPNDDAMPFISQ